MPSTSPPFWSDAPTTPGADTAHALGAGVLLSHHLFNGGCGIEDAEDRRELREIARAYSAAADSYFYAALARMSGNGIDAMRNEYEANSYFEFATLAGSWRALSKFAPVRLRFANLVKQRYDEFCLAQEDSNQDQEHLALKALERGCGEFKGLIHESLD